MPGIVYGVFKRPLSDFVVRLPPNRQTARTGAAEYGGVAAAENDAHSFLARLEQDKDNEGYTYDDMQGKNQGLHGGNSSAGWTMPALNRLCQ